MTGASSAAQRFWAKVDRRGPDECWPWTACTLAKGYGRIKWGPTVLLATRVAWEIANGQPFPKGRFALHRCDNPRCVNPRHIYAGTRADNALDSVRSGTHPSARKTHCVRGHSLLDQTNLIASKVGERICKACARMHRQNNRCRQAQVPG